MSKTENKSVVPEVVKIVVGSVLIAIVYGIAHDMVTAHTEISYFTIFHPRISDSNSPVVMALMWGVIATWWIGAIIGVLLALCAQLGSKQSIPARYVLKSLTRATAVVFIIAMATLAAMLRFCEGKTVEFQPDPSDTSGRFLAVLITHNVSYFLSALVAVGMCVSILVRRSKPVLEEPTPPPSA